MAAIRLTNMIRDIVKTRLLERTYKKREEKNEAEMKKLADCIYRDLYPPKIRKQLEAMPDGFMCERGCFGVNFQGQSSNMYFTERKRVAHKHTNRNAVTYPATHPICQKWVDLTREQEAIREEKKSTRIDIGAVLDRVTTVKKLLEIWPEVEPWVKDFVEPPVDRTNLPALPITELNKTLGLEKKTA